MSSFSLKGCGTALVTPFRGGVVDMEAFASLVDRQVEAGIHFLVPLGTTGETPCLDLQEKRALLQCAREHAAGKPVMVGVGTNSLRGTLNNIKEIKDCGADLYLVVAPYYNKPTQEGLYQYFKAVAESSDKPVVLYNVPGRTSVNLEAETTLRLAEDCENIIAVKEASANYPQICEILRNRPESFSVLSGNDNDTLALMATGADGVISVASNVAPKEMVALVEAMQKNDIETARGLNFRLMPLFKACFAESNPIPAKAALSLMGMIENELRLPLTPAADKTLELMKTVIKDLL